MKKHLSTIVLILVFIVGLSVLLYPTVSDYINSRRQSVAIVDYEKSLENFTSKDYDDMFRDADDYNEKLQELPSAFHDPSQITGYSDILNINGTGVIGYITIDKIRIQLPIYHGTSETVLNSAVGHLEGSSIPAGGEGTHSVLSAHRGLPSANLFTNLDKLEVGDSFTVTVLNRFLTYEVDQIRIVEPSQVDELQIKDGEDYCTLVTCTPYGINTHRILVRGTRIENAKEKPHVYVTTEAYTIDPIIATPLVAAPILLVLLILLLVKYRKKKD